MLGNHGWYRATRGVLRSRRVDGRALTPLASMPSVRDHSRRRGPRSSRDRATMPPEGVQLTRAPALSRRFTAIVELLAECEISHATAAPGDASNLPAGVSG